MPIDAADILGQQSNVGGVDLGGSKPADQPTVDNPKMPPAGGMPGQVDPMDPPKDVIDAFQELLRTAALEYEGPWKSHFRQNVEAEAFWIGNHYGVPSEDGFAYKTPFEFLLDREKLEDLPTYQYVINLYQAFGLAAITILAQRIPKVRWFPALASDEVDITTAKAASKLAAFIEDKNKIKMLAQREAYLSWTQGMYGTWTRYIRDKKFGQTDEPIIEETQALITPDAYVCDSCGAENEASTDMPGTTCSDCGAQLSDQHFVEGERAPIPVVSGYKKVPNGMVKLSTYGATNLCVSPYANEFDESGYLILNEEVAIGAVRKTWPDKKEAHSTDPSNYDSAGSGTDSYARQARLSMADAPAPFGGNRSYSGTVKNIATVKRAWFRDWYLLNHSDEAMRTKLIEMYPDGAFVAFADGKFLEAKPADVDREWALCYPMPGQGLYRQSLGASTIPINKQVDDAANIVAEHVDFGSSPPMFVDAYHVNTAALGNSPMKPGVYVPVQRMNGGTSKTISEFFHQPQFKLDTNVYNMPKSLIEVGQIVSGIMPSLFGGPLKGNDTLGAYAQSSNQATEKLLMFWQAAKDHHATVMTQAVMAFQEYQTEDVTMSIVGESGETMAEYVRLSELQGSCFARPESDEDFPTSLTEVRQNLMGLFQQAPDIAKMMMETPSFYPTLRKFVGNDEFEFPAEAQRSKTYREIDRLLQGEPVIMPQIDPMTGAMTEKFIPSIPVDVWIDNHQVAIATIREWGLKKGVEEQGNNPAGYANVMASLLMHYDAMEIVAQKEAMVQVSAQAPLVAAGGDPNGGAPSPNKDKGEPK